MTNLYFLANEHEEYTIYVTCKSNRKPDTKKKTDRQHLSGMLSATYTKRDEIDVFWSECLLCSQHKVHLWDMC